MRLIDADALKKLAYEDDAFDYQRVIDWDDIEDATTIDAVPVIHARWTDKGSLSCRCSHCGCKANDEFPYCPHCGARMDEKENSHG